MSSVSGKDHLCLLYTERNLLACPVCLGRMGLPSPTVVCSDAFRSSHFLWLPLYIKSQDVNATVDCSIAAKLCRREIHQLTALSRHMLPNVSILNFLQIYNV